MRWLMLNVSTSYRSGPLAPGKLFFLTYRCRAEYLTPWKLSDEVHVCLALYGGRTWYVLPSHSAHRTTTARILGSDLVCE